MTSIVLKRIVIKCCIRERILHAVRVKANTAQMNQKREVSTCMYSLFKIEEFNSDAIVAYVFLITRISCRKFKFYRPNSHGFCCHDWLFKNKKSILSQNSCQFLSVVLLGLFCLVQMTMEGNHYLLCLYKNYNLIRLLFVFLGIKYCNHMFAFV